MWRNSPLWQRRLAQFGRRMQSFASRHSPSTKIITPSIETWKLRNTLRTLSLLAAPNPILAAIL